MVPGAWAIACVRLAKMYDDGRGVPKDTLKAAELRAAACARGDLDSCVVAPGAKTW
ncbi:MAG: SEL1-like repeat protein [Deltaproteobacteria bacterium]|nr:SEL1-like repeat protein [Deltaproteobacteria bacterium]